MFNLENFIDKNKFLEKVNFKIDEGYSAENSFSLITCDVFPVVKNISKENYLAAFSTVAGQINSRLTKNLDAFSFWDNKFFIYSTSDNDEKIKEFINLIVFMLDKKHHGAFCLRAGFAQYPYDAIDIMELTNKVKESTKFYRKAEGSVSKFYDNVPKLGESEKSSMELINEIHHYMKNLSSYDSYLFEHSLLVSQGCIFFAKELELEAKSIRNIAVASILHDVGYLAIPSTVINKEGKLSPEEWGLVKMHPILATRKILKGNEVFQDMFHIIEQHHEFMDGSGYPFGLKGDDICVEAQVLSMLDTYHAVSKRRSYRRALSIDECIDIFLKNAGIKWDEDLITIFSAILGDKEQAKNLSDTSYSSVAQFFDIL